MRESDRTCKQLGLTVLLLHNFDPTWCAAEKETVRQAVDTLRSALIQEGHSVTEITVTDTGVGRRLRPYAPEDHIVFNWCEELPGLPRSDAQAARIIESLKFAYTGSPPEVLAFGWDKAAVKSLLARQGLPVPHWRVFRTLNAVRWRRFPAIVKPAMEHCSVGLSSEAVVLNTESLRRRIDRVLQEFRQPALVEDFIDGREFHVTLWGNGRIDMLPPAEMDFSAFDDIRDRLCTYESKFIPGSDPYEKIEVRIPAALKPSELAALRQVALKAYRVTGCRDYARIDLRLHDGIFYVLDVNPNADISPDTSLCFAAGHAGYSYGAFNSRLLDLAAERHPRFGKTHR